MTLYVFTLNGKHFVYASEHPKEARIIELTDDYRAPDGTWILPEPLAWDGVETHPGLAVALPDGDA